MKVPLACLSPEEMQFSVTIGYTAAGLGIAITLIAVAISIHRHNFRWLPFYALLLAVHPAWTVSILRGDCGDARRFLSGAASLIFIALLLVQIFRPQLRSQRFLLGVCAFAWILYVPLWLSFLLRTPFHLDDDFFRHIIEAYTLSSREIAHIAFVLTIACVAFWLATRLYVRRKMA